MAFVKLDCNIVDSTLWVERDGREVFITALLMAMPREFTEPVPQISVDSTDYTGFEVPAGWYGFVPASGPGIVRRAMVEPEAGKEALRMLGSPDAASRSSDYDGRRMIRVDGGYLILNYIKYREKDHTAAKRQERYRLRKKEKSNAVTEPSNAVTSRNITQAYADAEEENISKAKQQPKKERARKRAALVPLPEPFEISARVRAWAEGYGYVRLEDHLEHFVTQAKARAYVYADWDSALMNAIRKDWAGVRAPGQSQTIKPTMGKTAQGIQTLQGMKHGNSRSDPDANAALALSGPGRPASG